MRNLLHTETTVTREKCVIASGKLQTDAAALPTPPPPPPICQLISVRDVCNSALGSADSLVAQGTGASAPDLPSRMNAAQRRALTNFLKLQEVPGGLCHLQTTQSGAKSIQTVSKWGPCEDTVKAYAVSGQNPWPDHYLNRTMHHSIFQKYQ